MNDKEEEMAGLMKEQQRRIDDLHGRVIRLETVLELALNRPAGVSTRLLDGQGGHRSPDGGSVSAGEARGLGPKRSQW